MPANAATPRAGVTATPTARPWLHPRAHDRQQAEDALLASLLIGTWALTTGRVLRSDVPPGQLSAEELIAFWADETTAAADPSIAAHPATRAGHR